MPATSEAFFLTGCEPDGGQRYCLLHTPQGPAIKGAVFYVPPFAEEMNKSRRMAAMQARALAEAGFAVLQMDLLGCGDSSGDFGDATWEYWLNDIAKGCTWIRTHFDAPLWLWGLRTGCLLASEAARRVDNPCNFLFWAPATAGKTQLQQFLRLKAAAELASGGGKGTVERLRQQLASGTHVEVAGYMLAPGLCAGLEQAHLVPPQSAGDSTAPRHLDWFELTTLDDATLSPVAAKAIAVWEEAGLGVRSHVVQGPSFWQTTEIEDAPALVVATVKALVARASAGRQVVVS